MKGRILIGARLNHDPAATSRDLAVPDMLTDDDSDDEFNAAAAGSGHSDTDDDFMRLQPIATELKRQLVSSHRNACASV